MGGLGSLLNSDLRHVVISVNPKAGAVDADARVVRLVDLLESHGLDVSVLSNLDEVACKSNHLHSEGHLRTLIGVGGDGTAAELVNRTLPGVPLTIFPSGNENLLARHFGLGASPEECAKTVVDGTVVQCDAGRANDRLFLLMCSCGFDADVVHALHLHRTGHVNSASYFNPIMATIRHYDYPELRVYWGDNGTVVPPASGGNGTQRVSGPTLAEPPPESQSRSSEPGTLPDCSTRIGTVPSHPAPTEPTGAASDSRTDGGVRWLFAFNLPCYGGGLHIAPQADAADGLLDVCTFRQGGLWHGLYYTAAVLTGTHHWLTDFALRRSGCLHVASEGKVPYQLDGDPGGFLPVDIAVVPKRLTLLAPQERQLP